MGIFGNLISKIFPSNHPAVAQAQQERPQQQQAASPGAQAQPGSSASAPPPVDIEAVLNGMAQNHAEKLNWRTSIVDLMKLVGMDSSLSARKELAKELN